MNDYFFLNEEVNQALLFFRLQLCCDVSVIHFADGLCAMWLSEQLVNGRICLSCCAFKYELLLKSISINILLVAHLPAQSQCPCTSFTAPCPSKRARRLGLLCGHSDGLLTGFLCNRRFFLGYGTIYCFPALMLCLAEPKSMVKCLIIFSEALCRRPQCLPLSRGVIRRMLQAAHAFHTRNV